MGKATSTERSLGLCRDMDWLPCVVERWLYNGSRKDCFGFGDVLVMDHRPGAVLIQATTIANAYRVNKLRAECAKELKRWLENGNRFEIWAWHQRKPSTHWRCVRMSYFINPAAPKFLDYLRLGDFKPREWVVRQRKEQDEPSISERPCGQGA